MGLQDIILGGDPMDPEQRLINKAVGTFYRAQFAEKTGAKLIDRLLGREDLSHEDQRLSILMKKRALGLPLDDADYEKATNEGLPFRTFSPTLFGPATEQLIPSPGFLKNTARVPTTLQAIFGTAFKATPEGKAYNVANAIFRTARRA